MSKFIQTNKGTSSQNFQAEKIIITNDKKNEKDSLSDRIKNHPVIIYAGIAIMAFGLGFGTKTGIETASNQELITKGTYVLKEDIESKYISIELYNEVKKISKKYEISLSEKESKINELQKQLDEQQKWQKRYDALVKERDGFETELNNMINFSTGLIGYSEEKNKPKREELLRKIKVRDEQINLILETINSKK